jgi:signal transduction histidine kinase
MTERAESLGGTLTVATRAEGGTELVWRVPVQR